MSSHSPTNLRRLLSGLVLVLLAAFAAGLVLVRVKPGREPVSTPELAPTAAAAVRQRPARPQAELPLELQARVTAVRDRVAAETLAPAARSADLATVVDMQSGGASVDRTAALRRLGKQLSAAEIATLAQYLLTPAPASDNMTAENAIKNDVMRLLLGQDPMPADAGGILLAVFADPALDTMCRDYAVQHFMLYLEKRGAPPFEERCFPRTPPPNLSAAGGHRRGFALPAAPAGQDIAGDSRVPTDPTGPEGFGDASPTSPSPAAGFAAGGEESNGRSGGGAPPSGGVRGAEPLLASLSSPASSDPELLAYRAAYRAALQQTDASIAGTALLGMDMLARRGLLFGAAEVAAAAVTLVQSPAAKPLSRITALQIAATHGAGEVFPVAISLAADPRADVSLRMSAIAAAAALDGARSRSALAALLEKPELDTRLRTAATAALSRIDVN